MEDALDEIRSRLLLAGEYTKAINDAGSIDPEQDVRKLAVAVEELVMALDVLTVKVLPALTR
jgi:hypothetical protein